MTITTLRKYLRSFFGDRMYKIDADGVVSAHGQMPNSTSKGWYAVGYATDHDLQARMENRYYNRDDNGRSLAKHAGQDRC